MSDFFGVVEDVQQTDLKTEEQRILDEREQRRLLRLQVSDAHMTTGELLQKLAGESGSNMGPVDDGPAIPQEVSDGAPAKTGFPPPPRST